MPCVRRGYDRGMHRFCSDAAVVKAHSPFLSFNVEDMDRTVRKLLSLGAELDGPIKYLSHGKVRTRVSFQQLRV